MIHAHDPLEVQHIKFKKGKRKEVVDSLAHQIEKALTAREEMEEKKWAVAVQQYHSALPRENAKAEDSKLDVPTTRQFLEMAISRFVNPIFQRDEVLVAKPTDPKYQDVAKAFENFCDWMVDRGPFRLFNEHYLKQAYVYTKAVAKVPFRVKTKKVKLYHTKKETANGFEDHWGAIEGMKLTTKDHYSTVSTKVEPEVIPTPDFIHPIPTADIETAPWVCHRVFKSLDDIKRDIKRGVYEEKNSEGDDLLEVLGDPTSGPDSKLTLSLNDDKKEKEDDGQQFEIMEVYTTWDDEEVIVTYERRSKECLRFIENFYHEEPRPFVVWSYEHVLNDIDGISLCYILEPLHRAVSGCLNQRLDAASKALETLILFNEGLNVGEIFKDGEIVSGAYPVSGMPDLSKQVAQFNLSQPFTQMETLEGDLKRDMQKLAGLTDYNAGVEQIQRPTATGQVALIEEGRQPQYNRMESYRQVLAKIGTMMVARYRQFNPVEMVYYLETRPPEKSALVQEVMQWPTGYWQEQVYIEPAVSSQTMNRDLRKQEWLALVDKMPQVFQQLMHFVQAAMTPSPISAVAARMLDFYMKFVMQPWLEEFEIAGREFLNFEEDIQVGQMFAETMQQLQQQIEELGGEVEQRDEALAQLQVAVDHLSRAFVVKTGELPPPPPQSRAQASGQAAPAGGMDGSAEPPGAAGVPPMG